MLFRSFGFPEYTGLGLSERSSDRGDARLLAGSKLTLAIEPSMPLSSARLLIDDLDTGDKRTIELTLDPKTKLWTSDWTADHDAKYQVKLTAEVPGAEAPIENTYSPFYEIDVIDDQAPNISWMVGEKTLMEALPSQNQMWIVSPQDFVRFAAAIADDLPNAKIQQEISVNRQPWKILDLPLNLEPASDKRAASLSGLVTWTPLDGVSNPTRATAAWSWDLLKESLASGDLVSVRLGAVDSAGHVTYSIPIQLSLATEDFDRNRHQALYYRAVLGPELQKLADLVRSKRTELRPKMLQLKDTKLSSSDRENISKELRDFSELMSQQCARIRGLAGQVAGKLPRPLDQTETELVVRVVSKFEKEHATAIALAGNIDAWKSIEIPGQGPSQIGRAHV